MIGTGTCFDADLLLKGFVAGELQAQVTAGFQYFGGQWGFANQAIVNIEISSHRLGAELHLAPGWQQCNIDGLGGAQAGNINLLLEGEVPVFTEFKLVGTATDALNNARYHGRWLAVDTGTYITEIGADIEIARQGLQL